MRTPVKEQLVRVTQSMLQGAKRFATTLASVTVPSFVPGRIDTAVAKKDYAAMLEWWCSRSSPPDPTRGVSFACRRQSVMEKLRASDRTPGAEREAVRSKLLAELPKLPQLTEPDAKKKALAEARQMLQEYCSSAQGSVRRAHPPPTARTPRAFMHVSSRKAALGQCIPHGCTL